MAQPARSEDGYFDGGADYSSAFAGARQPPFRWELLALAGTAVVLVVSVVLYAALSGSRQQQAEAVRRSEEQLAQIQQTSDEKLAQIQRTVLALQATPTAPACDPAQSYLKTVADLEAQGKPADAARMAENGLTTPHLCPDAYNTLSRSAVEDSKEALFVKPPHPADTASQRGLVTAYNHLRSLAKEHHLEHLPSIAPLVIAQRAYNLQLFPLSQTAYQDAYRTGALKLTDRSQLFDYYSAARNAGSWLAMSRDPQEQQEGRQTLMVACRTSRQYQLASTVACDELVKILGPDESRWPAPAPDPLLESGSESQTR